MKLEIGHSEVGKFCWSWKGIHVVGKDKWNKREIGKVRNEIGRMKLESKTELGD